MSIALEFCSDPLIRKAAQLFQVDPIATLETKDGFTPLKVSPMPPEKAEKPKPKMRAKKGASDLTGDLFG